MTLNAIKLYKPCKGNRKSSLKFKTYYRYEKKLRSKQNKKYRCKYYFNYFHDVNSASIAHVQLFDKYNNM